MQEYPFSKEIYNKLDIKSENEELVEEEELNSPEILEKSQSKKISVNIDGREISSKQKDIIFSEKIVRETGGGIRILTF